MLTILQAGAGEVILSALAPGTDVAPHCARARGFCCWEGKLGKVLRKGNGVFGCFWVLMSFLLVLIGVFFMVRLRHVLAEKKWGKSRVYGC